MTKPNHPPPAPPGDPLLTPPAEGEDDILAFDSETTLIGPSVPVPGLVCLSFAHVARPSVGLVRAPEEGLTVLRAALTRGATLVGANVAFDVSVCCRADPSLWPLFRAAYDEDRLRDVQVRAKLIANATGTLTFTFDAEGKATRRKYNLAALAVEVGLTLEKGEDTWRMRYAELLGVPPARWPSEAWRYSALDAVATLAVFRHQLEVWNPIPTEHDQTRAAWALRMMEVRGLTVDLAELRAFDAGLKAAVIAGKERAKAAGFVRPNGTKDLAALEARVSATYGGTPPTTPTGKPSTAAETLLESGDPDLVTYGEIAGQEKLLSAFVPGLYEGATTRWRPAYDILKETGRTSASKSVQQMPRARGARECVVPRPGFWFVSVDYNSVELRTLAQVCLDEVGSSELAELYRADRHADPHLAVGAQLLGISLTEAQARRKAGDKDVKGARQLAKAANFGYPGGLGPDKFRSYAKVSYGLTLTEHEATELRRVWREANPSVVAYQRKIAAQVEQDGGETTLGLPRDGLVRGRCGYTDGCNFGFQGLAAWGAKRALWLVERDGPEHEVYPVAFLHDEILAEVPADPARATRAAQWLGEAMVRAMETVTPDVPQAVEPALMTRWRKEAEPVWSPEGLLLPWEPPSPAEVAP